MSLKVILCESQGNWDLIISIITPLILGGKKFFNTILILLYLRGWLKRKLSTGSGTLGLYCASAAKKVLRLITWSPPTRCEGAVEAGIHTPLFVSIIKNHFLSGKSLELDWFFKKSFYMHFISKNKGSLISFEILICMISSIWACFD